jgi:hypothetical protein
MITGWQNESIPILKGVDDLTIQNFELKYCVKLPEDMKEYFSTVNGMGDHYDEEWFNRLWPIEDVRPTSEWNGSFAELFPQSANCFLFFDHSIDLVNYAIRLSNSATTPTPIFRIFDHPDRRFDRHCNSFTEFAALFVNDPAALY